MQIQLCIYITKLKLLQFYFIRKKGKGSWKCLAFQRITVEDHLQKHHQHHTRFNNLKFW